MFAKVHWDIGRRVTRGQLPLFVNMVVGKHPERLFHDHNCSEIAIVINGSAEHIGGLVGGNNSMRTHIKRGDVLVIHPSCVHAYDKTEGMELWNLVYASEQLIMPQLDGMMMPFFQKLFPAGTPSLDTMVHPVLHLDDEVLEKVKELILKINTELKELRPGSIFASMTLFMQLVMVLARFRNDKNSNLSDPPELRISNAISYMNSHYHERKLSIDKIAAAANMSKRNFCRYFSVGAGCAPGEYLLRLRLSHAILLLGNTDHGQEYIARECGFSSSPHFSRIFTKFYGVTPSVFRRKNRYGGNMLLQPEISL